jgi:exodeoxyribonuclease V alpha subunit
MSKLHEITAIFRRERIRWDTTAIIECDPMDNGSSGSDGNGNGNGNGNSKTAAGQSATGNLATRNRSGRGLHIDLAPALSVKVDECQPDDFHAGLSYRFYGRWESYTNKRTNQTQKQFRAKTFVRAAPHGREGVTRYLQLAPGVGLATAQKLWERFQSDAVRILREHPDVASAAVGGQFGNAKASRAAEWLEGEKAAENVTIDLTELFAGRGFPRNLPKLVLAEWGNKAAELIRRNPYLLRFFPRCGFARCDGLYMDLGGDPVKLKRQSLVAWYMIDRDNEGHTWFTPDQAERLIREKIGGAGRRLDPVKALRLAKRAKLLAVHRDRDGRPWIADAKKADNETVVAKWTREARQARKPQIAGETDGQTLRWPDPASLPDLTDHQRAAVADALAGMLAILTGSPGTGKSFSAARIIGAVIGQHGLMDVAVCAPTGKAAVRLTEMLLGEGIDSIQATTIHRLLGVSSRSEGEGWGFDHTEDNPLPHRFVIVDEASMIDTNLMASLLRACRRGCHVLLVGDTNQLPPVGHGAPLRDLIAAGVPTGRLTKIERNWGAGVQACADIRDGTRFQTCRQLDLENGQNLQLIHTADNAATADRIERLLRNIGHRKLFDPVWQCQVIVAVNRKSELSRRDLNRRLQAALNPAGEQVAGSPFRVGDKVVCLKNGFYPVDEDHQEDGDNAEAIDSKVFIANGEIGRVVAVREKLTTVRLDGPPRTIKVPRGKGGDDGDDGGSGGGSNGDNADDGGQGCQWDLGYAISCHKSQGSEFPCVIIALDEYPGARMVCSREWLYTAISRFRDVCFLVGKKFVADAMCKRLAIQRRKTFLRELIEDPVIEG